MALAKTPRKEDRLELRLEREKRQLLDAAAQATGLSTSAFVLSHATAAAQNVLADRTHFVLSADHWHAFIDLLDSPDRDVSDLAAFLARPTVFQDE